MINNEIIRNEYEIFFSDYYVIVKDIPNNHYLRLTGNTMEYVKNYKNTDDLYSFLKKIFVNRTFPKKNRILNYEFKKIRVFDTILNSVPDCFFNLICMISVIACAICSGVFTLQLREESIIHHSIFYIIWIILNIFLHELGHCCLCIKSGRSVGSFGIKLNYYMPMMYVDTSDICMSNLKNKVATSLGGIYFNAILCLISSLGYFWSGISLLSDFSKVSLIFVISNLIPFLKLDGYYIVSDLLGETDLKSSSNKAMLHLIKKSKTLFFHDYILVIYFILKSIFLLIFTVTILYQIYTYIVKLF